MSGKNNNHGLTKAQQMLDAKINQGAAEVNESAISIVGARTEALIDQIDHNASLAQELESLDAAPAVFKKAKAKKSSKSFFARFFLCAGCCGDNSAENDRKQTYKNR